MIPLAMNKETIPDINESRLGIRRAEGHLNYFLDVFGDHIAQREGYSKNLSGMEAVHFYLIHKFGWLPRDVRSMSLEDVRFVLNEEMNEWKASEEAMEVSRKYPPD